MKKNNIITLLILVAVFLSSCNDFLNEDPISTASPNTFWKSKEDADLWTAGTYDGVQYALRTAFLDWGENRSDNVLAVGTGNTQLKMYNNAIVAGDKDLIPMNSWQKLYTVISRCNYGLKYLPVMIQNNVGAGTETYKDYMGQYYGLRALMYFYATRVWGRVPIVGNEPIESLNQINYLTRSPIDSVKKVILADLDKCILNINSTDKKYYFSLGAAYALKADVHMWFKEYDLAMAAILKLEALNYHKYVTNTDDWKKIFTDPTTSSEVIFSLHFNQLLDGTAGSSGGIALYMGSSDFGSYYSISKPLFTEYANRNHLYGPSVKDVRWVHSFDTLSLNTIVIPTLTTPSALVAYNPCGKYFPWDASKARAGSNVKGGFIYDLLNRCSAKIPVYRYADIQLLKAEIYCQKGEYQKALDIVNLIRKRVGFTIEASLADFTVDPASEVLDCILKERRLEFYGEGKRWFDLIRVSNSSLDYFHKIMDPIMAGRSGASNFLGDNEGKVLFPIESTAFAANPGLRGDQNPPYSE